MIGSGGIGGIDGSLIPRTEDRSTTHPGIYRMLACNVLVTVVVAVNTIHFRREDKYANWGQKVLEGDVDIRYTL